jgi:hypothetical protein
MLVKGLIGESQQTNQALPLASKDQLEKKKN